MNRDKITLSGSLKNGGKFQYDMELNAKGLLFWGKLSDPSSEKEPTRLSIDFSIPGIVPDSRNKTMAQLMPIIGDGNLVFDPVTGTEEGFTHTKKSGLS